jgi:tRNA uridine 5-carboxymethylaminomethyl modification enzyme
VVLDSGEALLASKVIITTGTFLGGRCYIGQDEIQAGRFLRKEEGAEPSSVGLAQSLRRLKFPIDRLRTGTPPRLDGKTINYKDLDI